jgi:2-oxoglutarate dehydrogenase E1 component
MRRRSSPLSAVSVDYVERLYEQSKSEPGTLDESWRILFEVLDILDVPATTDLLNKFGKVAAGNTDTLVAEAVRERGHLFASLNPLASHVSEVNEATFTRELPHREHSLDDLIRLYCGGLTLEVAHIDDPRLRNWLIDTYESANIPPSRAERLSMLHNLIQADEFERFLGRKLPGKKRFGAEGAEGIVVLLQQLLKRAAASGVTHVVLGTMHRGRLNVITNILGRSPASLLAEMKGAHPFPVDSLRPGDVPYHLGCHSSVNTGSGIVTVTLIANPSHLEAIDPVVLGHARALQDSMGEDDPRSVLPIIIHTDAAVVAQGIVAEALQLGATEGFTTRGAINIVMNNQIGFTTEPFEARTSTHCTGAWKAIDSCILHANGEDLAAIYRSAELAIDWRMTHGRDAVIDFVCYRRNGHNEIDEPTFTQPLMYQKIVQRDPVAAVYARDLIEEGITTEKDVEDFAAAYRAQLDDAYEVSKDFRTNESGYMPRPSLQKIAASTGADLASLRSIADELARPPENMSVHPKMDRILRQRAINEQGVAWPLAEALAFGSLLVEGVNVRLTGQDVVRGAFSQRHFNLVDTATGYRYMNLAHLQKRRGTFALYNSPLSEYAVLGFEYGYSLNNAASLVIWEAQFGDFANGAQIVIDQFIAAGEEKWCARSGLVLLLPHGLEGQGPEHSSARLERFLQLAGNNNLGIVNPSTPANYFHLLRRQAYAADPKPLVVMGPKRLLRLPAAVSPLDAFGTNSVFEPLIITAADTTINRILLCTGKIAYDLEAERAKRAVSDVAIVRIEELYPLPQENLRTVFARWPKAVCVWVQEEPSNMGAWVWLDRRIENLRRAVGAEFAAPFYVGRPEAGSPAGSFHGDHDNDQLRIFESAFDLVP